MTAPTNLALSKCTFIEDCGRRNYIYKGTVLSLPVTILSRIGLFRLKVYMFAIDTCLQHGIKGVLYARSNNELQFPSYHRQLYCELGDQCLVCMVIISITGLNVR